MISDAIEVGSLNFAVDETVPVNKITLKCDICESYTNQYVKHDGLIKCKKCFAKKLDKQISHNDKIFILKDGLFRIKEELKDRNAFQINLPGIAAENNYEIAFDFAYSSKGMDKNKSDAKRFASYWADNFSLKNLEQFKAIYFLAYSSDGMDKNRSGAQRFAIYWMENHSEHSIEIFKKVYLFSYYSNGLDKNRSGAQEFAIYWLKEYEQSSFSVFQENFYYAYSSNGLNKNKSSAIKYALHNL